MSQLPFETAPEIVPGVCYKLRWRHPDLPEVIEKRAVELAARVGGIEADPGRSIDRTPGGIAAASVYLRTRTTDWDHIKQKHCAHAAGVSPVCERQTRQEMLNQLDGWPIRPDSEGVDP